MIKKKSQIKKWSLFAIVGTYSSGVKTTLKVRISPMETTAWANKLVVTWSIWIDNIITLYMWPAFFHSFTVNKYFSWPSETYLWTSFSSLKTNISFVKMVLFSCIHSSWYCSYNAPFWTSSDLLEKIQCIPALHGGRTCEFHPNLCLLGTFN